MKLYLAVAVLVLAFVAYAEAQEETLDEKFTRFGEHLSAIGRQLAEKAKTTFQSAQDSDFGSRLSNWFQENYQKLKGSIQK